MVDRPPGATTVEVIETVEPGGTEPGGTEDRPQREDYQSFLAAVEGMLDRVDGAIARLAEGTYGSCEVCREPIDDADLERTPAASCCSRHLPTHDFG